MEEKIMSIGAILSIAMIVYVLVLGLLTALPARKHHWIMALIRTGIIILSVVVAVPVSKAIAGVVASPLAPMFEGLLGSLGEISDLMTHAPILEQSIQLMFTLILVPAVFLFVFLILRGILSLVAWIVGKFVPFFKTRSLKNTAIAMPVGALNGILVALITLVPICGYVMMFGSLTGLMDMGGEEQNPPAGQEEVMAYAPSYDYLSDAVEGGAEAETTPEGEGDLLGGLTDLTENPVIKVLGTVGTPLFDWMMTGTVDGGAGDVSFCVTKDLPHLVDSVTGFTNAFSLSEDGEMSAEDKQAMLDAVDYLMESDWVAEVMAQSIGYMATQWQNGESFMGMEAPDMGEMLQPVMNKAWEVLSTENGDTLRQDLRTVTEVLADLMSLGFGGEGMDSEHLMGQLGSEGALAHMMQVLGENEHMAVLADEIRTLSLKLAASAMGDALKNTDQYDGVMNNMADSLNNVLELPAEERREVLQQSVKEAFAEQEIDVPEEVAVEMSEKAIADLGGDGEITGDELKNYFIEHMDENAEDLGGAIDEETFEGIEIPDMN